MTSRFEEARQEEARTARLAAQTEALKQWLEKSHPEIPFCIALLKEFRESMLGAFFTADDADWEYALNMIDTRYLRQHVPTEKETKAELIETILEKIASADGGRDGKFNPANLKSERIRMSYWSVSELTARLNEVVEKQRLQPKSAGQIRQELQASRPTPQVKVLPAEYTRQRIHQMPSFEIKKLIRDYTATVVNDRLFGRS